MVNSFSLRQVEEAARQEGADRARVLPARDIVIDERVRLKCLVPLCPNYGRNLMCPPNLPGVEEFRRIARLYQWALLLQVLGATSEKGEGPEKDLVYSYADKLHRVVNSLERRLQGMGFLLAAGFIGGSCRLCEECVGQGSREPCRHPFRARPSMEAMGVNVAATAAKAGLGIAPFPLGREVVWTGLILLD
ncbi:MAG TPA: DUF2284 domain-containing protein [Firmicutes bacterium]|nr:DUF2284 domain-containing protein [Bacillota bacterium]